MTPQSRAMPLKDQPLRRPFLVRLVTLLTLGLNTDGDDPVCMSALDETTLGKFGFKEREITNIKDSTWH